ncbi:pilus assembly protein MshP [Pseudomonas stutzeri]|uniref:Pilus assembly protein MshP n=1 Tax=Stutzerimonas stutzeri TaxID=316 RepID=A0A2N8S620_STUST|nr:pilus assembly protein MshP [Stutzerimonas stutzeri]MCQ4297061.1 pilus assembly protein MshP [Stutzerimonas stutzeri]PNF82070.1 pilus assembly protein MshP [Stutzerimonas stutzeri]
MRLDARQRGFGLVAALFIIIVIASVIAAMTHLALNQSATNSMSLQQARAYQMAQAGLEWGIARAVANQSCAATFTLEGFSIAVACTSSSAGAVAEENKTVSFRQITATAQYAAAGSPDYAYRQLTAVVELP